MTYFKATAVSGAAESSAPSSRFIPKFLRRLLVVWLWTAVPLIVAAPGDVDSSFNTGTHPLVLGVAIQPDGGIIIGGPFSKLGDATRLSSARFDSKGVLDPIFHPNLQISVDFATVGADGSIYLGGDLNDTSSPPQVLNFARVNPDGSLNLNSNLTVPNRVYASVTQPDGKLIICGPFRSLTYGTTSIPCNGLARLNPDGSHDPTFNPANLGGVVYTLALQSDGKIIVGGSTVLVNGVYQSLLARLYSDGTVDTSFVPSITGYQVALNAPAVQPDGKILVGGYFDAVNGTARNNLARLNGDGTLDTSFNPDVDGTVNSIVLQADGQIIIGGDFEEVGGELRFYIARLKSTGALDPSFNSNLMAPIYGLALQDDGKIVIGGERLLNDPATQSLTVPSASRVQWLRGGSSPEAQSVSFELSTNSGATWTFLGKGTRMAGGWELNGLSLPASGHIRGRARTTGGKGNGSSSLLDTVAAFGGAAAPSPVYLQWSETNSVSFNPNSTGANSITNLENFGFGLSPTASGLGALNFNGNFANGGTIGGRGQPTLRIEGSDIRVLFMRRKDFAAAGLTYSVQFTGDLTNWQTSAAAPTVLADDGTCQIVSVPYPAGFTSGGFFRVSLSMP